MKVRLVRPAAISAAMVIAALAAAGPLQAASPARIGQAASESAAPSATPIPTPVVVGPQKPGATVIRWFCCLGAGDAPEQVAVEKQMIDQFNAAHDDIQIAGEFVLYAQAYDTLATEIAGGTRPDIIAPVGFGAAIAFAGHWLALAPYITKYNLDTSVDESSSVDSF